MSTLGATTNDPRPLLSIHDLCVSYGKATAVFDVSLEVKTGELIALLGVNGSGKSSIAKAVCGSVRTLRGQILFDGKDVTHWTAARRSRSGLVLVPEGRMIIRGMTVEENLLLGGFARGGKRALSSDLDTIYNRFPRLLERRSVPGGLLSGGEQQILAIGRALMARPKVMVLDEPMMGLAPTMVSEIASLVTEVAKDGTAVIVAEQNAISVLPLAKRVLVLETGRVVFSGEDVDAAEAEGVFDAFLGLSSNLGSQLDPIQPTVDTDANELIMRRNEEKS